MAGRQSPTYGRKMKRRNSVSTAKPLQGPGSNEDLAGSYDTVVEDGGSGNNSDGRAATDIAQLKDEREQLLRRLNNPRGIYAGMRTADAASGGGVSDLNRTHVVTDDLRKRFTSLISNDTAAGATDRTRPTAHDYTANERQFFDETEMEQRRRERELQRKKLERKRAELAELRRKHEVELNMLKDNKYFTDSSFDASMSDNAAHMQSPGGGAVAGAPQGISRNGYGYQEEGDNAGVEQPRALDGYAIDGVGGGGGRGGGGGEDDEYSFAADDYQREEATDGGTDTFDESQEVDNVGDMYGGDLQDGEDMFSSGEGEAFDERGYDNDIGDGGGGGGADAMEHGDGRGDRVESDAMRYHESFSDEEDRLFQAGAEAEGDDGDQALVDVIPYNEYAAARNSRQQPQQPTAIHNGGRDVADAVVDSGVMDVPFVNRRGIIERTPPGTSGARGYETTLDDDTFADEASIEAHGVAEDTVEDMGRTEQTVAPRMAGIATDTDRHAQHGTREEDPSYVDMREESVDYYAIEERKRLAEVQRLANEGGSSSNSNATTATTAAPKRKMSRQEMREREQLYMKPRNQLPRTPPRPDGVGGDSGGGGGGDGGGAAAAPVHADAPANDQRPPLARPPSPSSDAGVAGYGTNEPAPVADDNRPRPALTKRQQVYEREKKYMQPKSEIPRTPQAPTAAAATTANAAPGGGERAETQGPRGAAGSYDEFQESVVAAQPPLPRASDADEFAAPEATSDRMARTPPPAVTTQNSSAYAGPDAAQASAEMAREMDMLKAKVARLESEKAEVTQRFESAVADAANTTRRAEAQQRQADTRLTEALERQRATAEETLRAVQANSVARDEHEKLAERERTAVSQAISFEQEAKEFENKYRAALDEVDTLKADVRVHADRQAGAQQREEAAVAETQRVAAEVAKLQAEAARHAQKLEDAEGKAAAAQSAMEAKERRIDELLGEVARGEKECVALKFTVKQMENGSRAHARQLKEANERLAKSDKQLGLVLLKNEDLTDRVNALETAAAKAREQSGVYQKQLAHAEARVRQLEQTNEQLQHRADVYASLDRRGELRSPQRGGGGRVSVGAHQRDTADPFGQYPSSPMAVAGDSPGERRKSRASTKQRNNASHFTLGAGVGVVEEEAGEETVFDSRPLLQQSIGAGSRSYHAQRKQEREAEQQRNRPRPQQQQRRQQRPPQRTVAFNTPGAPADRTAGGEREQRLTNVEIMQRAEAKLESIESLWSTIESSQEQQQRIEAAQREREAQLARQQRELQRMQEQMRAEAQAAQRAQDERLARIEAHERELAAAREQQRQRARVAAADVPVAAAQPSAGAMSTGYAQQYVASVVADDVDVESLEQARQLRSLAEENSRTQHYSTLQHSMAGAAVPAARTQQHGAAGDTHVHAEREEPVAPAGVRTVTGATAGSSPGGRAREPVRSSIPFGTIESYERDAHSRVARLKEEIIQLSLERGQLDSEYQRLPPTRSIATLNKKKELETRLEALRKDISERKLYLRRNKLL